jgi:hypothetical protein
MLGKWVNAGRALTRVVIQNQYGISRQEADARSFDIAEEVCLGINKSQVEFPGFDLENYTLQRLEPGLQAVREAIEYNPNERLSKVRLLLQEQATLFAAYTSYAGTIARPGLTSGDVEPWIS